MKFYCTRTSFSHDAMEYMGRRGRKGEIFNRNLLKGSDMEGIIRRNLINRLDTILFSAQNVLDDEKDNARRILSNPDISSLN